jgi:hypothetical protein
MTRAAGVLATVVVCLHLTIYCVLSLRGRYEPFVWGLGHVKSYVWAPAGFVDNRLRWNGGLLIAFLPWYYLDTHLWHSDEGCDSGKYPVNWIEFPSPNADQPQPPPLADQPEG